MAETYAFFSDDMSYHIAHSVLLLVLSILAILAVALRFWARKIQKIALEPNDYLIVAGLIFALAEITMYIYASFSFWIKARERLGYELSFISPILWAIAVTSIRSSIILLYVRIFSTRSFRIVCYAVLTLNAEFSVAAILAECLICSPIACRFDYTIECRSSGDQTVLDLFTAVFNMFLDITVVVLPIPILWGLQTAVSRKLMLTGIFGLGTAVCAITAYRVQVTATIDLLHEGDDDQSISAYGIISLLTCLEAILGVITACLPVLNPVFNKARSSLKKLYSWKNECTTLKYGSTPTFMWVSHMLERTTINALVEFGDFNGGLEEKRESHSNYFQGGKSGSGETARDSYAERCPR
ncbi:MAG: hypothetical protein ASARMPREDX12_005215 [Alectoria sarmentosa]|nr:MAG: hypothetical protein ASARMPREDX12_005215 [Alectoria sarmentosa]